MNNNWYPMGGNGGIPSDCFSSEDVGIRRIKTQSSNYNDDAALGKIEGVEVVGKVHRSSTIGNVGFTPAWGSSLPMVFPTSNETWVIESDSENDTLLGSGAHSVLVVYLDQDYIKQSVTINLNGTTPVVMSSDCFRPVSMLVVSSGASEFNDGLITLSDQSSGNPRGFIQPTFSTSQDTYASVPAGKVLILLKASPYIGKDDSGRWKGVIRLPGTNTRITNGNFPVYQNTYDVGFEVPFILPEKTDYWFEFISNNQAMMEVNFVTEFRLEDV